MASIQITDDQLANLKDKVVFITGGASGIGLATANLCLTHGAKVIIGDLNPVSSLDPIPNLHYIQVDVSSWTSQQEAFAQIEAQHGRLDHVFANAGIRPTTDFLDDTLDENGQLTAPDLRTINVNLIGVLFTLRLGQYYIQKNSAHRGDGELGSIVVSGSTASLHEFSAGDYTVAKHGVLGIIRGLGFGLQGKVRLNAVAPSWTATGIPPKDFIEGLGVGLQGPEAVARSAALLFADQGRHGEVIYSWDGKFLEVNKAEGGLLEAADRILINSPNEETVARELRVHMEEKKLAFNK